MNLQGDMMLECTYSCKRLLSNEAMGTVVLLRNPQAYNDNFPRKRPL